MVRDEKATREYGNLMLSALIFRKKVKRLEKLGRRRDMTLDDVLKLYNKEVRTAEERLLQHQKERQEIRIKYFLKPLMMEREIRGINWLLMMDKEVLAALTNARDRLLEEMVSEAL